LTNVGPNLFNNATDLGGVNFGSTALTAASIENILVSFDTRPITKPDGEAAAVGSIVLNGGTSAGESTWTTAALSAKASLVAKGFTITSNP
jgi:hypothetical protein